MGTVTEFPTKPRVDDYFGGCPICGRSDDCMNIGRDHWYVCHQHRTKWHLGSNLFSSWRHEDEDVWRQNFYRLATYREVEPLPCTELMERRRTELEAMDAIPESEEMPF